MKKVTTLSILFCALETVAFLAPTTTVPATYRHRQACEHGTMITSTFEKRSMLYSSSRNDVGTLPKAIIFDLDGCLWTPEMYEIMYFMGGKGAPFTKDPQNNGNLLTCGKTPVKLLGDVRAVFQDLYRKPLFRDVRIGISSRTDRADWARELLEKFEVTESEGGKVVYLADVMNGPIEIEKDSKVDHFRRIHIETGIEYEDMLFFDNEFGNCEKVASLGVSVVYCPSGVTRKVWDMGIFEEFPRSDGTVINGDQRGWRL